MSPCVACFRYAQAGSAAANRRECDEQVNFCRRAVPARDGLSRLASALPVNEYLTTRPEEDGPGWRGDPIYEATLGSPPEGCRKFASSQVVCALTSLRQKQERPRFGYGQGARLLRR